MNFILCRKKTRLSRDKVSDTISRLTHTCDTNSNFQFFFQMESNIRGDVQLQNFWKHLWKDRYCIRSIPSSHAHIKLFSATTRKTGVSSLLSRRRSRDFSTMIRAGRKSRRQMTHGVTYISTESNRIDGKASLRTKRELPASRNGRDLSLCQTRRGRLSGKREFESCVVLRLRTCHFCHEVINKRHPVPSLELRDWSTVNVDPTSSPIRRILFKPRTQILRISLNRIHDLFWMKDLI